MFLFGMGVEICINGGISPNNKDQRMGYTRTLFGRKELGRLPGFDEYAILRGALKELVTMFKKNDPSLLRNRLRNAPSRDCHFCVSMYALLLEIAPIPAG